MKHPTLWAGIVLVIVGFCIPIGVGRYNRNVTHRKVTRFLAVTHESPEKLSERIVSNFILATEVARTFGDSKSGAEITKSILEDLPTRKWEKAREEYASKLVAENREREKVGWFVAYVVSGIGVLTTTLGIGGIVIRQALIDLDEKDKLDAQDVEQ
jgi:hypothetical protein